MRTDANRDYNNQQFDSTCIDFIDYRSSNICNFKCRSCSPLFSHGIDAEAKANTDLVKFYKGVNQSKTVSLSDVNQQWITNNLGQINRLMITGGEPTVMPSVKNILHAALESNPDIHILITTNGSFTDEFWYDITRNMPNLHWTLSLDAVGSAAEIVRHGTVWSTVEHNAIWLAKHARSFSVNTVISNLNLVQLKPLLEFVMFLKTLSSTNGCDHLFHVCQKPDILAADNITKSQRAGVLQHLSQCLDLSLPQDQQGAIAGLIDLVQQAKIDSRLLDQAQTFNTLLDSIRNERSADLYT